MAKSQFRIQEEDAVIIGSHRNPYTVYSAGHAEAPPTVNHVGPYSLSLIEATLDENNPELFEILFLLNRKIG
jgi:hypothetical protein